MAIYVPAEVNRCLGDISTKLTARQIPSTPLTRQLRQQTARPQVAQYIVGKVIVWHITIDHIVAKRLLDGETDGDSYEQAHTNSLLEAWAPVAPALLPVKTLTAS